MHYGKYIVKSQLLKEVKLVQPSVSVVIPVYNGEKYIKKCLDSLSQQTLADNKYEIIIVDNGSSDISVQIAENYNVKLLKEPKRGSYAARNKGIKNALGDIIAFTDVDCIVAKDWLEQAVKYYDDNKDAEIIAGQVEFFSDQMLSVWGYFDKNTFLNQEYSYNTGVAKTANLFVAAKVFKTVGLFDGTLQSGGDVDWTAKAVSKGISIHYEPKAVVYHPVRNSFNEIAQKVYRVGSGKGQVLKNNYDRRSSNFGKKHLKHPFKILGEAMIKKDKEKPSYHPFQMVFVLLILGFVFLSGMGKGLLMRKVS